MDIGILIRNGSKLLHEWWDKLRADILAEEDWPVGRIIEDNFIRDDLLAPDVLKANGHPPHTVHDALEVAARHFHSDDDHIQSRGSKVPSRTLESLSCLRPTIFKRYYCLGAPADMKAGGEEWVSFFKIPSPDPERVGKGSADPVQYSMDFLRDRARKNNYGPRSILWFTPLTRVEETLGEGNSLVSMDKGFIDKVRDRLGLAHFQADRKGGKMELAAVVVSCFPCCPRVTVPTVFDSRGYDHFFPADPAARWGRTAPLDGTSEGIPEVIVWIDDERHPNEMGQGPYQSFWNQVHPLARAGHSSPCTFFVGPADLTGYRDYRMKLLDEKRTHAAGTNPTQ